MESKISNRKRPMKLLLSNDMIEDIDNSEKELGPCQHRLIPSLSINQNINHCHGNQVFTNHELRNKETMKLNPNPNNNIFVSTTYSSNIPKLLSKSSSSKSIYYNHSWCRNFYVISISLLLLILINTTTPSLGK